MMFSCPRIEFFLPMDRVLPLDCRLGSASLRIAWANPMVLHSFWLELKLDSSKSEPAIATFLASGHTEILGNIAKLLRIANKDQGITFSLLALPAASNDSGGTSQHAVVCASVGVQDLCPIRLVSYKTRVL